MVAVRMAPCVPHEILYTIMRAVASDRTLCEQVRQLGHQQLSDTTGIAWGDEANYDTGLLLLTGAVEPANNEVRMAVCRAQRLLQAS